jgi:hypothetical protein
MRKVETQVVKADHQEQGVETQIVREERRH